jgi:hypothetical protein
MPRTIQAQTAAIYVCPGIGKKRPENFSATSVPTDGPSGQAKVQAAKAVCQGFIKQSLTRHIAFRVLPGARAARTSRIRNAPCATKVGSWRTQTPTRPVARFALGGGPNTIRASKVAQSVRRANIPATCLVIPWAWPLECGARIVLKGGFKQRPEPHVARSAPKVTFKFWMGKSPVLHAFLDKSSSQMAQHNAKHALKAGSNKTRAARTAQSALWGGRKASRASPVVSSVRRVGFLAMTTL